MAKTDVRQAALATARQRRIALDQERDARDGRIEQAAADVLVLVGARAEAQQAVRQATAGIAEALRRLLGEDVTAAAASELVGLEAGEVRRLTKPEAPAKDRPKAAAARVAGTHVAVGHEDSGAARRVG
jgi:hypothetical protein